MIVIGGATATGKTALAVEVAKRINGEIIGADSMQIYKRMNVGTAKPTEEEKCGIRHYMIDVVEPNEPYSVAEYKKQATETIKNIKNGGKVPIVVGGTGLYVNSLIFDYKPFARDDKLRDALKAEYETCGAEYMHEKLRSIDPKAGEIIHYNNVKRVLRALEVKILTGESVTDKCDKEAAVPALVYVLGGVEPREKLYERINRRVDAMFDGGLEKEISGLLSEKAVDFSCQSMQAIGYKEFKAYYEGTATQEEVKEKIKQHTRNYAKRQITWFKGIEDAVWLGEESVEEKADRIVGDYYNYFCKL